MSTVIPPETGGALAGGLGETAVEVSIPAGVSEGPITVSLCAVEAPPDTGGFSVMGQIFAITATDEDGKPITQFGSPFTLKIYYQGADWPDLAADRWVIHYWNEEEEQWISIPTRRVEDGVFEATLDHLTIFGLIEVDNWPIYLPAPQKR